MTNSNIDALDGNAYVKGAVHHCGVNNWVKDGVNITPNI